MALKATAQGAAEAAVAAIGRGYDVVSDVRLKYCKGKLADPDARLIDVSRDGVQDVLLPGIKVAAVPKSVTCDKGERTRFRSDVLSFQQMSELFNRELSLTGKIPSGMFNSMFDFSGCWQKDAANTKSLAFDGWYISLYTLALSKSRILLRDHVTQAVPSTWDPAALARFIDKFGTHIKRLKDMSDMRFLDGNGQYDMNNKHVHGKDKHDARDQRLRFVESSPSSSYCSKEDLVMVVKRRGGKEWDKDMPHSEWINTVQSEPDVISMSFLPITSLLSGVPGCGFLNHAINLYLRCKFVFHFPFVWQSIPLLIRFLNSPLIL
ncbi:MACPF domain-containing protein [Zea mays]|uniref:MACPF domain-containing protein n=1 Tax=Zea mays TaxID=4577 RepID=A0A3L6D7B8_MAIZE|nr:MACPF domain-containing protein [Zea mays]